MLWLKLEASRFSPFKVEVPPSRWTVGTQIPSSCLKKIGKSSGNIFEGFITGQINFFNFQRLYETLRLSMFIGAHRRAH
jgi:hypothetical protein